MLHDEQVLVRKSIESHEISSYLKVQKEDAMPNPLGNRAEKLQKSHSNKVRMNIYRDSSEDEDRQTT